ncbi:hypothetical protein [Altererythrobacter sp. C41]|uniref:hypothetical protein n=1 Tax=Altererythrobacter sp. C41 TaxID=2806021 RepID=UPI001933A5CB|nr:hypothetical protein [Altererythrobacter sp. C41]MBM0169677.1 hypothetical protein [Altererythrobacter sp. C41]
MDERFPALVANPAIVLVSLGAIAGLLAASYWLKVARSVDTSGDVIKGPDVRDLSVAAILTGVCLFLMCGGFLFGRFTGEF